MKICDRCKGKDNVQTHYDVPATEGKDACEKCWKELCMVVASFFAGAQIAVNTARDDHPEWQLADC